MPAPKALKREYAKLKEMTASRNCWKPIPALIRDMNRNLDGWANYFRYGHPRRSFRKVNRFARRRLGVHLRRRIQRPFRPPKGMTFYRHFANLGLTYL